jgi:ribosomal protein S18 acetylase RimI-like enzyme
MSVAVEYRDNTASESEVAEHLLRCDGEFVPPLSDRLNIPEYADKIVRRATRFEAWSNGVLVGFVAAYCNDQVTRIAHITTVSVMRVWTGQGIAACLINRCVEHARAVGMVEIGLDVAADNAAAINLYKKAGFVAGEWNEPFLSMRLSIAR